MRVNDVWSSLGSFVFTVALTAASGAALAGAVPGAAVDAVVPVQSREVQQQDPNTPPDCKKFPTDTRCKDKR